MYVSRGFIFRFLCSSELAYESERSFILLNPFRRACHFFESRIALILSTSAVVNNRFIREASRNT